MEKAKNIALASLQAHCYNLQFNGEKLTHIMTDFINKYGMNGKYIENEKDAVSFASQKLEMWLCADYIMQIMAEIQKVLNLLDGKDEEGAPYEK